MYVGLAGFVPSNQGENPRDIQVSNSTVTFDRVSIPLPNNAEWQYVIYNNESVPEGQILGDARAKDTPSMPRATIDISDMEVPASAQNISDVLIEGETYCIALYAGELLDIGTAGDILPVGTGDPISYTTFEYQA